MKTAPNRSFTVRVALAALGLLLSAFAGPAAAGISVSAPAGGVMPTNAPFSVHWTTSLGGQISIRLESTSVPSHNYALLVTGNTTATGQALVSFPASADCDPQEVYRIGLSRTVGTPPMSYVSDQGYSAPFRFACPMTITKQVINTTGRRVAGTFRMRVQCEPGSQTFVDIAAFGQGYFTRKANVPPGSTVCTVQETGMPLSPRGCNWLTTYPGGQQWAPGGAPVIVVNTLQCGPITPPGPR